MSFEHGVEEPQPIVHQNPKRAVEMLFDGRFKQMYVNESRKEAQKWTETA